MGDGAVDDLFKADEIPEAAPFFYAIEPVFGASQVEPSGFNLTVGFFNGFIIVLSGLMNSCLILLCE